MYGLATLLCTGFGLGRMPRAPGTWGSLGAVPFAWAMQQAGGVAGLGLGIMFVCALAIWAIPLYLRRNPGEDPGEIVIDEVAGQWVALLAVPAEPLLYLAGFALFRFFDIVKPWPVSWADRALPGAIGILLDDILAGVYAFALLQIFLLVR